MNFTNTVKEEEFEIDETEDELRAADDILKNKLRRLKGDKKPFYQNNKLVGSLNRMPTQLLQAEPQIIQENAQDADADHVITRSRSYSYQESMFT